MKLDFSRQIFESNQISNLMKVRPEGAELFHADGHTCVQLIVAFRNFTNPLERSTLSLSIPWRHLRAAEIIIRALDGGGRLTLAPAALPPGKNPGMHWKGGWVGPRACLDVF